MVTEEGEDRANNVRDSSIPSRDGYGNMPPQQLCPPSREVAWLRIRHDLDTQADAVTLLTLHTAKDWNTTSFFIVGMEEGILPP